MRAVLPPQLLTEAERAAAQALAAPAHPGLSSPHKGSAAAAHLEVGVGLFRVMGS